MLKIQAGQTLLSTGDSITDSGRTYPLGAGSGLGDGYVALVESLLAAQYPQIPVRISTPASAAIASPISWSVGKAIFSSINPTGSPS